MRVLVVTNMFPTAADPWAGCFVQEQVEDLRALGVDATVFHFDGRRDRTNYGRAVLAVRRRLRHSRFDLVHAHYGLTGAVALLARPRVPIVTTFTGSDTGYVPWQAGVSRVVARLTAPIFVAADGARRLGIERPTVIPAGVDLARFVPAGREEARRALGLAPGEKCVLFPASRARPVKRADLFDAAVAVARREASIRTVSLEGVPRERVGLVMRAVDATLMTSDSEGSPVTVKESLASGTPVVSVPVGDVPDVIGGLPGCSVEPRDPERLGPALVRALERPPEQELRARAARFSRDRVAERTLAYYNAVLEAAA